MSSCVLCCPRLKQLLLAIAPVRASVASGVPASQPQVHGIQGSHKRRYSNSPATVANVISRGTRWQAQEPSYVRGTMAQGPNLRQVKGRSLSVASSKSSIGMANGEMSTLNGCFKCGEYPVLKITDYTLGQYFVGSTATLEKSIKYSYDNCAWMIIPHAQLSTHPTTTIGFVSPLRRPVQSGNGGNSCHCLLRYILTFKFNYRYRQSKPLGQQLPRTTLMLLM